MSNVTLVAWVFAVKVAPGIEQVGSGYSPSSFILLALGPPFFAVGKFFKLEWRCLGVIFPTFGERLLVVPDVTRRSRPVEKQDIGLYAGVWRENAIRQANDRVEVELLQQLLLDACADAIAE